MRIKKTLAALFSLCLAASACAEGETISETSRQIPVIEETDVVVVGGGFAAAAAALEAKAAGASVFVVMPRQNPADDLNARVLTETDSGCDAEALANAVANLDTDFLTLPWIVAYPAEALPLVRTEFASAATDLFQSDSWVFENNAAGIAADGSYFMDSSGDDRAREVDLGARGAHEIDRMQSLSSESVR